MEYLKTMPFYKKVYFSQNDLKVFGLIKGIDIKHIVQTLTVVGNFNRHAAPKDLV